MLVILAGDFRQAEYLAQRLELPRQQWKYARDSFSIQGFRGSTLLAFGTWYTHPHADELLEVARRTEMVVLYVRDDR